LQAYYLPQPCPRGATAAVIPAPITANLVNFDNIPGATEIPYPGPLTTELVFEGVIFSGFGRNGGAVLGTGEIIGLPEISPPNFLVSVSAFPMANGGLPQSPEFIDFYPPITSMQFDTGTAGIDCQGTMVLTVQGFRCGRRVGRKRHGTGARRGRDGTAQLLGPASRVAITSTHTCGPPGFLFHGVELFTIDNLSFTPVASAASKCATDRDRRRRQEGQGRGELLLQGAPEGPAGRHGLHPKGRFGIVATFAGSTQAEFVARARDFKCLKAFTPVPGKSFVINNRNPKRLRRAIEIAANDLRHKRYPVGTIVLIALGLGILGRWMPEIIGRHPM
jgi:hypothetical protein